MSKSKGGVVIPKSFLVDLIPDLNGQINMVGGVQRIPVGIVIYLKEPSDQEKAEILIKRVSWLGENLIIDEFNLSSNPPPSPPETVVNHDIVFDGYGNDQQEIVEIDAVKYEFNDLILDNPSSVPFGFGFISYRLLSLFLETVGENSNVLLCGVNVDFGSTYGISGEYFTFKMEPFPDDCYEDIAEGNGDSSLNIGVPGFLFAIPCPPRWKDLNVQADKITKSAMFYNKLTSVFYKSLEDDKCRVASNSPIPNNTTQASKNHVHTHD